MWTIQLFFTRASITLQYLLPQTIMTTGTTSSIYVLPEGREINLSLFKNSVLKIVESVTGDRQSVVKAIYENLEQVHWMAHCPETKEWLIACQWEHSACSLIHTQYINLVIYSSFNNFLINHVRIMIACLWPPISLKSFHFDFMLGTSINSEFVWQSTSSWSEIPLHF